MVSKVAFAHTDTRETGQLFEAFHLPLAFLSPSPTRGHTCVAKK